MGLEQRPAADSFPITGKDANRKLFWARSPIKGDVK